VFSQSTVQHLYELREQAEATLTRLNTLLSQQSMNCLDDVCYLTSQLIHWTENNNNDNGSLQQHSSSLPLSGLNDSSQSSTTSRMDSVWKLETTWRHASVMLYANQFQDDTAG